MFDFLKPYVGVVQAVSIIAIALAIFGAGYHVRDLRADRDAAQAELAHNKAMLRAAEAAIEKTTSLNQAVKDAQDAARNREPTLRAAADSAGRAADSLRQQLADNQRRMSRLAANAVAEYAATVSAVLSECADDYRGMAQAADAHASDVRTLMDAWPK